MKGLKVFSAFDGISCGQLAFQRVGIPVEKYFASEICDYSIKIAKKNFPDTIEVGDVRDVKSEDYKDIDILIGGSPCQSFSFAGTMSGMTTKEKQDVTTLEQYLELKEKGFEFEGYSYLFWEYVRLLKELKPKYFLLENVKMSEKWKKVITDALGIEPILIDSGLLTAQHRERLYWTNIPNVEVPKDKNVVITDILENITVDGNIEKFKPSVRKNVVEQYEKIIHSERDIQRLECGSGWQDNKVGIYKTPTLRHGNSFCLVKDKDNKIRRITVTEAERLQTLPDGYTESVSDSNRFAAIGNGWTVDVIAHIFSYLKAEFCQ